MLYYTTVKVLSSQLEELKRIKEEVEKRQKVRFRGLSDFILFVAYKYLEFLEKESKEEDKEIKSL